MDRQRVFDRSNHIYLKPGEFFFGHSPQVMRTLLGSCVAITLWHPSRHIGGMCHFLLPDGGSKNINLNSTKQDYDGRYGRGAIGLFMQHIKKTTTRPADYQAKIFGGANMFPDLKYNTNDVGRKNIAFAKSALKSEGFKIEAEHVGDSEHRTLIFDLKTGHCWLRSGM